MQRASSHLGNAKIRRPFIAALLSRLRCHDFVTGAPSKELNAVLDANPDLRQKCIDVALQLFTKPADDALLLTRWGLNLVQRHDLPWLISRLLRETLSAEREKLAYLIRFTFYPDSVERIEMVVDAANQCRELRNVLDVWLETIEPIGIRNRSGNASRLNSKNNRHLLIRRRSNEFAICWIASKPVTSRHGGRSASGWG